MHFIAKQGKLKKNPTTHTHTLRGRDEPIELDSPLNGCDFKLGHTVCKHCNRWTEAVQCVKAVAVLWTETIITAHVESHFEP